MTTAFITHPDCLLHEMGSHHPESPARLRAINAALEKEKFASLLRLNARIATRDEICLAHPPVYYDWLEQNAPMNGLRQVDGDTMMNAGTWDAALLSAGGALLAVDEVMGGHVSNAFVATRPPGHHAERKRAMGFCFFNNVVIAAKYAQKKYGIERVAIVDFDVHHGNGTQDLLWSDKSVMFASTHEMPLFPGTGELSERGDHEQIFNCPLRAGDGREEFMEAFESRIFPALHNHSPELIIISAGFDAHFRDPLGNIQLTATDFGEITAKIKAFSQKQASGKIISVLEGGYDLEGLSSSVAAHVKALIE